jgi:hypothetical protein
VNGREIFRKPNDTEFLHLGHPVMEFALDHFSRIRHRSGDDQGGVSQWTVTRSEVPNRYNGAMTLTVQELAVNQLREPLHEWVNTFHFGLTDGNIERLQPDEIEFTEETSELDQQSADELWLESRKSIRNWLSDYQERLSQNLRSLLNEVRPKEIEETRKMYTSRINQLSSLHQREESLERKKKHYEQELDQQTWIPSSEERDAKRKKRETEKLLSDLKERLKNLTSRVQMERDQMLEHTIPKRYSLIDGGDEAHTSVQVFPVGVKLHLPE